MKKLLAIFVLFSAFALNAQDSEKNIAPTYEKEGSLVKVTMYYSTGEVKEQGFYDANKKLTGKWEQFSKEGKSITIANYYNGKKVGKWFVWKGDNLLEVDYNTSSQIASVNEWKGESTIADN